jgi:hypothetical protein
MSNPVSALGHSQDEEAMERIAIVVRLKEGSGPRAAELIEAGPPFDLAETGVVHHTVYLSAGEVVFVFEGPQVEWIVDGPPRIDRERFGWGAHEAVPSAADLTVASAR